MGSIIGLAHYLSSRQLQAPLVATLRFASIVLMGIIFADTTAPDDLSRAIGTFLSPIPQLNGYRIGATLELTLSTIPLIFDVVHLVSEARKARNESVWRHPVRRIVSYSSTVFTLLLERAEEMEAALTARNFNPNAKRDTFTFSYRDSLLMVFVICFTVLGFLLT